jgi:hypothetical protein
MPIYAHSGRGGKLTGRRTVSSKCAAAVVSFGDEARMPDTIVAMPIVRCPRCFAEDISADAHPSRRIVDQTPTAFFVCRNCFRAAELAFRIACDSAAISYEPLPIRESLRLLQGFYRARLVEAPDDPRVAGALADVERRLAIGVLERAPKLDA